MKKPFIYPANKRLISEDLRIDELPALRIRGRRKSDRKEGWFYFSAVKGSYNSVQPDWVERGDEIEFFEPLEGGQMRSLTLPGVELAGGSVSRMILEGGNILLFSNISGVHQSFYLLKPGELEDLREIIIDSVYIEESCPQCGSRTVFHHRHAEPKNTYSKCLSCGYDWQGKMRSDLVLVKKNLERSVARQLERHPHLKQLLRPQEAGDPPPTGV